MNSKTDNELFEQARKRVQNKTKGRCISDKDVIIDLEKEIEYYRDKIKRQNIQKFNKELEIEINNNEYLIKYHKNTDAIMLNTYLIKIVEEKDTITVAKDNEFIITNKTRHRQKYGDVLFSIDEAGNINYR